MEQIANYFAHAQEHTKFPGGETKSLINHPFMIQLRFFDMQEEQEKTWEDYKRHEEAMRISEETKISAAVVKTKLGKLSNGSGTTQKRSMMK